MSNNVKFYDYSVNVKSAIKEKANRALFKAFTTTEPHIEQVAKKYFGDLDK